MMAKEKKSSKKSQIQEEEDYQIKPSSDKP
jgi:hypothetical protein